VTMNLGVTFFPIPNNETGVLVLFNIVRTS